MFSYHLWTGKPCCVYDNWVSTRDFVRLYICERTNIDGLGAGVEGVYRWKQRAEYMSTFIIRLYVRKAFSPASKYHFALGASSLAYISHLEPFYVLQRIIMCFYKDHLMLVAFPGTFPSLLSENISSIFSHSACEGDEKAQRDGARLPTGPLVVHHIVVQRKPGSWTQSHCLQKHALSFKVLQTRPLLKDERWRPSPWVRYIRWGQPGSSRPFAELLSPM